MAIENTPKAPLDRKTLLVEWLKATQYNAEKHKAWMKQFADNKGQANVDWTTFHFERMAGFVTQAFVFLQQQEEEIQELKARLEALENPKPIKLKKKRPHPLKRRTSMDKQQKKEIKEVILKYIGNRRKKIAKTATLVSGTAIALGIGIDLIATGGTLTALASVIAAGNTAAGAWAAFGTSAVLAGVACEGAFLPMVLLQENSLDKTQNTAGQTVKAKSYALDTLKVMESQLKHAFWRASQPQGDAPKKIAIEIFQGLAAEIEQDVKKLSPAFNIVSGGPNGFGMDKYEFIVAERMPAPGQKKLVTLTEALKELTTPPPSPQPSKPEPKFDF